MTADSANDTNPFARFAWGCLSVFARAYILFAGVMVAVVLLTGAAIIIASPVMALAGTAGSFEVVVAKLEAVVVVAIMVFIVVLEV